VNLSRADAVQLRHAVTMRGKLDALRCTPL
jgi:hypothetical protein